MNNQNLDQNEEITTSNVVGDNKASTPDRRITISLTKEGAEQISGFFNELGSDVNRSRFIENALKKEIERHEEKQRAKEAMYVTYGNIEGGVTFLTRKDENGQMDFIGCEYEVGYAEEAETVRENFSTMADGVFFTQSERMEIFHYLTDPFRNLLF